MVVSEIRLTTSEPSAGGGGGEHDQWTVLTVGGELDIATAPILQQRLDEIIDPAENQSVALDVSGLRFCDSSGLGLLVRLWKRLQEQDGRLLIIRPPDHLSALLKRTGLDRLFLFRDSFPHGPA